MNKIIFIIILVVLGFVVLIIKPTKQTNDMVLNKNIPSPSTSPTPIVLQYNAQFKIITNGTTRIFTDSRYHNKSQTVFIEKDNPNTVVVKGNNIKWNDFFATLPMKVDKECLTTGTGQVFCTSKDKKLYFYINDIENPNALDEIIRENDFLLIEYK